ncbi:hypothetical protein DXG03_001056 [Asterophora parasitica]|uniref:Actin-like protein ARP6 n=1 Tax=Asterophora parasitica TaxID=117018 RepID=A0A9P7G3F8_9AGAR|nr:hypothetical protein DXG03_001056 [Asterophora parasitica]
MNDTVVVLDNGASTIKAGIVNGEDESPRIISNAVVRSKGDKMTYFGHEFAGCTDYSSLHYRLPFEKGYLVDWDAQKAVWDGIFSSEVLGINTTESSLLITEPYFNITNLQEVYDQFVFEEYEFQAYYRCTPASLVPYGILFSQPDLPSAECVVVVDSGFSYTHVVPLLDGKIVWSAVKRLDVGGKLLTNQLKELVSFRQWNMMDETYIMNDVKESCCYVSQSFKSLDQSGLSATIAHSICLLPKDLQGMFWANIGLIGGTTKFTGFRSRLMSELQSLAPTDCDVRVYECDDPITEAYRSAVAFASMPGFTQHVVTRAEYAESGSNASRRKFHDWKPRESEKEKPKEVTKAKGKQREDDRSQAPSKPTRTRSKLTTNSTTAARRR